MTKRIFGWDEIGAWRHQAREVRTRIVEGEHMQLLHAEIGPGGTYPMHSHPHEQFSLMISGRMRLTVGDETREIGPGDVWHAPPNVEHGGELLGDEGVVFIDVYGPRSEWLAGWFETHGFEWEA